MIRPLMLVSLLLPSIALASAGAVPCDAPALAPLPDSVPAPEMRHVPAAASCLRIDAMSFVARLRAPAPAPAPAAAANAPATAASGAYVPKTAHDNTPWRFDMNQNGRRMTAEEFDAWMKAKGIRVATGRPQAGAAAPAAPATTTPAPAAAGCQASATQAC